MPEREVISKNEQRETIEDEKLVKIVLLVMGFIMFLLIFSDVGGLWRGVAFIVLMLCLAIVIVLVLIILIRSNRLRD
ncbi:MAG: hypothetical protein ACXAEN_25385 [Candidatus Thorarchaeota archaeon]|jgi:uncharacterized membrane protein